MSEEFDPSLKKKKKKKKTPFDLEGALDANDNAAVDAVTEANTAANAETNADDDAKEEESASKDVDLETFGKKKKKKKVALNLDDLGEALPDGNDNEVCASVGLVYIESHQFNHSLHYRTTTSTWSRSVRKRRRRSAPAETIRWTTSPDPEPAPTTTRRTVTKTFTYFCSWVWCWSVSSMCYHVIYIFYPHFNAIKRRIGKRRDVGRKGSGRFW